ncbi:stimulator of interferon genes protein [Pyxicephalus adspersus]
MTLWIEEAEKATDDLRVHVANQYSVLKEHSPILQQLLNHQEDLENRTRCLTRYNLKVKLLLLFHNLEGTELLKSSVFLFLYNGEYLKALKASFCMRQITIFILIGAVCYTFYDEKLLPESFSVINLNILLLSNLLGWLFGLQGPTPAAISEITEKRYLNVAHGLAWSYYVGYLKFVLPALKDSVKRFNEENNNLLKSSETCRLHILIPLSCRIYGDLKDIDGNITFVKEIPPLYIDRAGIKGRVFKNNVYRILDKDHRPYYCIVEYATPLASLYEMSDVASAAFSKEDRIEQAKLFCRTLKDILENSLECRNAFRLVIYDDFPKGENYSEPLLSREILKHLKQQRSEEYDLGIRA